MRDGQGEANGHRRVDGITTLLQDFSADGGSQMFLRHHHGMLCSNRLLSNQSERSGKKREKKRRGKTEANHKGSLT